MINPIHAADPRSVLRGGVGAVLDVGTARAISYAAPVDVAVALGVPVLTMVGLIPIIRLGRWANVRELALVAYLAHVAIALSVYARSGITTSADAILYNEQAQAYAVGSVYERLTAGKEGFPRLMGWVYAIAPSPALGLVINGFFSGLTLIFVVATTREVLPGAARYAAWLVFVCPGFWFWGTLFLREPSSWLLISIAMWSGVCLVKRSTETRAWALLVVSSAALLWIRGPLALIVGGGVLAGVALSRGRRISKVIGAALFALVFYLLLGDRIRQFSQLDAIRVGQSRASLQTARSGFSGSIESTIPRVLFGPYPTEWLRVGIKVAPDTIFMIAVLLAAVMAIRRSSRLIVLIVPALGVAAALTVSSGNYGTLVRIRTELVILLIPMAALWINTRSERRAQRRRAQAKLDSVSPSYGSVESGRRRAPPGAGLESSPNINRYELRQL